MTQRRHTRVEAEGERTLAAQRRRELKRERSPISALPARRRSATRGVVAVEYTMLLVFVALPFVAGIVVAGAALVHRYSQVRNQVSHAYP